MNLGFGLSSSLNPTPFGHLQGRVWLGTSPSCQEECLIYHLPSWKKNRVGIATISYIFLDGNHLKLGELLDNLKDLYISVGLGDRERLKQYGRSISGLRNSVLKYRSLISAIASSSKVLVQFAAENNLDIILNTGDPNEISSFLDIISPKKILAYLPVSLPNLSPSVRAGYDSWVSKMVGSKRRRSNVETVLAELPNRLRDLEMLEIKETILAAPWTAYDQGLKVISDLDVSYN